MGIEIEDRQYGGLNVEMMEYSCQRGDKTRFFDHCTDDEDEETVHLLKGMMMRKKKLCTAF